MPTTVAPESGPYLRPWTGATEKRERRQKTLAAHGNPPLMVMGPNPQGHGPDVPLIQLEPKHLGVFMHREGPMKVACTEEVAATLAGSVWAAYLNVVIVD